VSGDSDEQREVRRRVLADYFPAWCAARETRDPSAFDPDWSFLTPGLARWFLAAIDQHVSEVRDGCPTLRDSSHNWLFENDKPRLCREGFLEVAAAGLLTTRFGWPPESVTFQSPPVVGTSRLWAFDLLTFAGDGGTKEVAIAGEAKSKQKDAVALAKSLETCGARGDHSEADCTEKQNHHRKYQGLLDYRPRVLWIIGPEAFSDGPDLVFRVKQEPGGLLQLEPVGPIELSALPRSAP
jgi:hypothetical protein